MRHDELTPGSASGLSEQATRAPAGWVGEVCQAAARTPTVQPHGSPPGMRALHEPTSAQGAISVDAPEQVLKPCRV